MNEERDRRFASFTGFTMSNYSLRDLKRILRRNALEMAGLLLLFFGSLLPVSFQYTNNRISLITGQSMIVEAGDAFFFSFSSSDLPNYVDFYKFSIRLISNTSTNPNASIQVYICHDHSCHGVIPFDIPFPATTFPNKITKPIYESKEYRLLSHNQLYIYVAGDIDPILGWIAEAIYLSPSIRLTSIFYDVFLFVLLGVLLGIAHKDTYLVYLVLISFLEILPLDTFFCLLGQKLCFELAMFSKSLFPFLAVFWLIKMVNSRYRRVDPVVPNDTPFIFIAVVVAMLFYGVLRASCTKARLLTKILFGLLIGMLMGLLIWMGSRLKAVKKTFNRKEKEDTMLVLLVALFLGFGLTMNAASALTSKIQLAFVLFKEVGNTFFGIFLLFLVVMYCVDRSFMKIGHKKPEKHVSFDPEFLPEKDDDWVESLVEKYTKQAAALRDSSESSSGKIN